MAAKILYPLTDDNQNLRKHMGSINSYEFFYSEDFLARRRAQGEQHQVEKHNPGRVINAKVTTGSPCSYTSSLAYNGRLRQKETITWGTSMAVKEEQHTWSKSMQSYDIRDIVRNSMYREARSLPIKSRNNEGTPVSSSMKYIDSPRPLLQSAHRKSELMVEQGMALAPADVCNAVKNSKDQRLIISRLSLEKKESEEIMKCKELPRLSLDSRETAMRNSLFESRKSSNQEHGTQKRSLSVVAKLMGLDNFPDSKSTPEICSTTTKGSQCKGSSTDFTTSEGKTQHQLSISAHLPHKNCEASSLLHHGGNLNARMEPAPWRPQDFGKSPPELTPRSKRQLVSDLDQSFAIYGETKRSIELSEPGYGKDLIALKQMLELLQQRHLGLKNENLHCSKLLHRSSRSEETCYDQRPKFSTPQNKTRIQDTAARRTNSHRSLAHRADKSTSLTNEIMNFQDHKNQRRNNLPECKNKGSIPWKGARGNSIIEPNSRTRRKTERVSPGIQLHPLKNSPSSTLSMELGRDRKHSSQKSAQKSSSRRKKHSHSTSLQSTSDQLSELSIDTRCSSNPGDIASLKSDGNNCDALEMEEVDKSFLASPINTYSRKHPNSLKTLADCTTSAKLATIITEQPSPVSVLDNSFYNEDAPSPVAKISTAFKDEEPTSPERGWYTEVPLHFDAGFQAGSRFTSENPPRHFRSESVENTAQTVINLDPDQVFKHEGKLLPGDPEYTLINRTPDEVLCSELLDDSKKLHSSASFNHIFDSKNVIDAEKEIRLRDELFVARMKSANLETLIDETSTETRRTPHCNLDHSTIKSFLNAEKTHEPEDWKDFGGEISRLVLDIERQIFKDLITEAIFTNLMQKPNGARRQLF